MSYKNLSDSQLESEREKTMQKIKAYMRAPFSGSIEEHLNDLQALEEIDFEMADRQPEEFCADERIKG